MRSTQSSQSTLNSVQHHPKTETLAAYAAGQLDEARAIVIATHLTMCDDCATAVADFEALGGMCLDAIEPVPMNDAGADRISMESFWARAGEQEIDLPALPASLSRRAANDIDLAAAPPLRALLKGGLDNVKWTSVAPGFSQHVLQADGYRDGALRLFKIASGTRMPKHTHTDEEFTLILRGAYRDSIGEFRPGDLADLDHGIEHAPEAIGDEDCICLVATNAPLVFKDIVGKIMQPFVRL